MGVSDKVGRADGAKEARAMQVGVVVRLVPKAGTEIRAEVTCLL